jgi:hypothetical protein
MSRPAAYWVLVCLAVLLAAYACYDLIQALPMERERPLPGGGVLVQSAWNEAHLLSAARSLAIAGLLYGLAAVVDLLAAIADRKA